MYLAGRLCKFEIQEWTLQTHVQEMVGAVRARHTFLGSFWKARTLQAFCRLIILPWEHLSPENGFFPSRVHTNYSLIKFSNIVFISIQAHCFGEPNAPVLHTPEMGDLLIQDTTRHIMVLLGGASQLARDMGDFKTLWGAGLCIVWASLHQILDLYSQGNIRCLITHLTAVPISPSTRKCHHLHHSRLRPEHAQPHEGLTATDPAQPRPPSHPRNHPLQPSPPGRRAGCSSECAGSAWGGQPPTQPPHHTPNTHTLHMFPCWGIAGTATSPFACRGQLDRWTVVGRGEPQARAALSSSYCCYCCARAPEPARGHLRVRALHQE